MINNTYTDTINIYTITGDLPDIHVAEAVPQVGSCKYKFKYKAGKFIFEKIDNPFSDKIDFIVDQNYNLKFGYGHYKLNEKRTNLKMAGTIKINKKGNIVYIDNDSGHYQPNQEIFLNFINAISKKLLIKKYIMNNTIY
jgi:hypothetical protein